MKPRVSSIRSIAISLSRMSRIQPWMKYGQIISTEIPGTCRSLGDRRIYLGLPMDTNATHGRHRARFHLHDIRPGAKGANVGPAANGGIPFSPRRVARQNGDLLGWNDGGR